MNPNAKFMTPRPAPPVPSLPDLRVGSSPAMSLAHKRSARSLSPAPRWTGAARRFFGLKKTCNQDGDAGSETEVESYYGEETKRLDEVRSATPSSSIRSRDMSPESLRRFLSDDLPRTPPVVEPVSKLSIPDEIAEENEDDDNFATSAVSESAPFTSLSPPPFQRSTPPSAVKNNKNESPETTVPKDCSQDVSVASGPINALSRVTSIGLEIPRSHFSISTTSSSVSQTSPQSTESRDLSQYSFFDESEDDDDVLSNDDESFIIQGTRQNSDEKRGVPKHIYTPFPGYSLPNSTIHSEKHLDTTRISTDPLGSPDLVARMDNGMPVGNTNLLSRPGIDTGLDDLVNDMGWMADVIQHKCI
ncbi:hypothetical protein AAE478_003592 [Parahypoxylon ruwenzoriense]